MLAMAYLLTGALSLVAGTAVLWGLGPALLAAGVLLVALGVLEARGEPTGKPEPARTAS